MNYQVLLKLSMSIAIGIDEEIDDVSATVGDMKSSCNSKANSKILDKLSVRFLQGDDIADLKVLCNDWFPIKYPDSWYKLIAIDDRFFSLAATIDQRIVAILIAEIKPRWQVSKEDSDLLAASFQHDTKVAYILSIGVSERYRRQGIASFLLGYFLSSTCAQDKLTYLDVKAIYLHVLTTNVAAIHFYERHKFKLLHFLPAYYIIDGSPRDGYSYVLHINGGKPRTTFFDCILSTLRFVSFIQFCTCPPKFFINISKLFRYVLTWPNFSPFVTRYKQCHNL